MMRVDRAEARRRLPAEVVTRFAPSPTGYLHLGHVVNAIYVWGLAGALGGSIALRIEDHDRIRCRPEFEAALLEDLSWLGFIDATAPAGLTRQRDRSSAYEAALEKLRRVAFVYACDCSRTSYTGERYPGRCRTRGLDEREGRGLRVAIDGGAEHAWDLARGALVQTPADQCGDLLIRDRYGQWTYQFAVTVDDLEGGITLVVRGDDLQSSTGRQVRLGRLLAAAGVGAGRWPPVYLHHPLIMGDDGRKLSKSSGSTGIRALRAAGVSPEEVIGRAAAAVGLVEPGVRLATGDLADLVTTGVR